ncbi:MAG: glucosaminidase domain-containing protein [Bacteroidota bacterium]
MQIKRSIFIILFILPFIARAQDALVIENYINTYKDIAIKEMQRTGVPAAIKLAQGIHETMAGTSDLVVKSNNHFGIKCKNTWTGASVTHDDDLRGECFRKYESPLDSYRDHSDFLRSSTRYSFLFNLEPTDYQDWAYGLKKAGYATNPRYPQIIIKLIEDYHLQDYSLIALGKTPASENIIAKTTIEIPETTPVFTASPKIGELVIPESKKPKKQKEQPVITEIKQPEKTIEQIVKTEAKQIQKITEPTYPEAEFKINETPVIYAKKGASFLSIAQKYNVPLARLFDFNDLDESEVVSKDQLIFLQRKRKTGNNEFHIVQAGETLYDIAQQEAIRLETLLDYNLLKRDLKPAIGEKLYLRSKAATAPRLALEENFYFNAGVGGATAMNTSKENFSPAGQAPTDAITYTVQSKETIYAISKKYNVNIDDIVKWNQLSNYDLKMGQQLKIYK